MLPTISDPHDSCSGAKSGEERLAMAVKALSRSASQPAVFPPNKLLEKRIKQLTKGSGLFAGGSGSQKQEDDLDIIKQIIETDVTVSSAESCTGSVETLRSQSLSHIPGQFPQTAGSLPSLLHTENMHVMHVNYNSAPDFMQFGKSCMGNFDGTTPTGLEGGEMGHLLRRDSQQTPFPGDSFQSPTGYSGLTGQDGLIGGNGMDVSRRNSVYESHSAAGTPVLTNESAQNTPQGIGLPFDFPHLRNSHLPGYGDLGTENRNLPLTAADFGAGPPKKWEGQPSAGIPNVPNTFHYIVPSGDEGIESGSSDGLLGRLQGGREGTARDDKSVINNTGMLSDYLIGGCVDMGGAKQQGEMGGAKQSKGGGGLELSPTSLKGMLVCMVTVMLLHQPG